VKDDRVYLLHILECLNAIRTYVAEGARALHADRRTRKATLRELQELSESTKRLSPSLRQEHPEIPWANIAGFRNVLVHDYLGLRLDEVWAVIERDLPHLRAAVEAMLRELPPTP
jgi:uncharacterized protein with HEPN domain